MQSADLSYNQQNMENKLFPIACSVVALTWIAWFILYASSESVTKMTTTYSVDELKEEIKEVSTTLLDLKWQKQQCKDDLTEYQTLAEYKWIEFYCSTNDAEIEKLKMRLAAILTMQYEQLDNNLNNIKQEKEMGLLANWTGTSLEKLTAFLQSE